MRRGRLVAGLALLTLTLATLAPTLGHEFISIDDPQYITQNPMVNTGLSRAGLEWALTTDYLAQWHPLTWLIHQADCQVFGLAPRGHLSVNLFLHAANVLLLFWLLAEATGRPRPSFVVAAVFAIHPLQVESVTWACQLKTMLATLWALVALIAYIAYARAPGARAHVRVSLAMALSLCSKMMGVTLPCLFLLLDFWPLGRVPGGWRRPRAPWPLVREKLPWFALALAGALVKLIHRQQGHELEMFVQFLPLWCRVAQAAISYATYPAMLLWPVRLALPYPHPGVDVPLVKAALCGLGLAVAALAVWRARVARPALMTGLLWYAGTLVPVIGLVQVGNQAYADRFMYLPMIGFLVAGAFALPEPRGRVAWTGVAALLLALSLRTRDQLAVWSSNESLLRHALAVTERNALAHTNLGNVYLLRNDVSHALEQYRAALSYNTLMPETYNNLGLLLVRAGRAAEAVPSFERALELRPFAEDALVRLVKAQHAAGQLEPALARCRAAAAQHPQSAELAALHALSAIQLGLLSEAERQAQRALALDPHLVRAQVAAGYVALERGRDAGALALFDQASASEPDNAMALEGATKALEHLGRAAEAADRAARLAVAPGADADVQLFAGSVIANAGRFAQALALLDHARDLRPRHADTEFRRAVVLEGLGRPDEARRALGACLALDPAHPLARRVAAGEAARASSQPLPPPALPSFR